MNLNLSYTPFVIAILLASHGLRKKSLSPRGAIAAFTVGFLTLSPRVHTFGIVLLAFYLAGSRATRVGAQIKAKLEEGHGSSTGDGHDEGAEKGAGGYRGARQVLCNSATACVAAVFWEAMFGGEMSSLSWIVLPLPRVLSLASEPYNSSVWCALDEGRGAGWSRFLLLATLGHFACCLGDTLASEIGILARGPPRLITTFALVPPGTNGAVSTLGLAVSAAGGLVMGLVMTASLLVENSACRNQDRWPGMLIELAIKGTVAGLAGSLLDSLLGATVQRTRFSNATKRILQDDTAVAEKDAADIKVVSGLNILTNNQVNLFSSIATAVTLAYVG